MDIVVVTGSSSGIGKAVAEKFLSEGFEVHGIDILSEPEFRCKQPRGKYYHHLVDVSDFHYLPNIADVKYLINNAGQQTPSENIVNNYDIEVNLEGLINTTQKYGLQRNIDCIINMASVSAHNGAEFGPYVASKGGVLSYTKWTSQRVAEYGGRCNSLSFGGVTTDLNKSVMRDKDKWAKIMEVTPLKKWATADECANWVYFLCTVDRSTTGQDIIIDNGETSLTHFVW